MRPLYTEDKSNYVVYNNPNDAEIVYEKFWLERRLFGIPVYRRRFRQDSTIMDKRATKTTGFKR